MVQFRANKIKQIDSNKVVPEFTVWCNKKADCLYKSNHQNKNSNAKQTGITADTPKKEC